MNQPETCLHSIRTAYPDLDVASVEFNSLGQNSDVILINGELVFRFPRYSHVLEALRTETALLRYVQGRLPLAVPAPIFLHLEQKPVGEAFAGYRRIPGEPLCRETFRMVESQKRVKALADQLASFLKALHNMALDRVLESKLPVRDTHDECADIYARIRQKLFPHMRPDAQEWAAAHFEGFLEDANSFAYEPVLRHGDFGPSNILFDRGKQRVTGVIDFSSSGLGDPAYDFAGLLSGYGEDFVVACGDVYPDVEELMGRIRFYQGTFALLEALFGAENGDEEAFRAGLEAYV